MLIPRCLLGVGVGGTAAHLCRQAQLPRLPGSQTRNVAGISETAWWRMGHAVLGRARMPLPAFLPLLRSMLQPCALIASASAVTGGSSGDIPDAAYLLLQCHLPVCGDRKPGALSE